MLTLNLPIPPSVNHAFVNVAKVGRVKSKKYKAWIEAAGWALKAQPHDAVTGKVNIHIRVRRPSSNSDIDNRVKPLLDLLVKHSVIDDDRNVVRVSAEWAPVDACEVTVMAA